MRINRTGVPVPKVSDFHVMISQEIATARERQRFLREGGARGWLAPLILFSSIILMGILLLPGRLNPDLFIIASFLLFMFYFITLLVPLEAARQKIPLPQIASLFTRFRDAGMVRCTERLSRILLNAFFMDCRPLFAGFALLFSVDILIVLVQLSRKTIPWPTASIIIFQSVAIITFYFLIWKLEPYSIEFLSNVTGVRQQLIRKRFPEPVVSVLVWSGAALALISVFIVIILLPGFTVSSILSLSELEQFRNLFLSIAVLLVCQYFVFRYIHGTTSRELLIRFSGNATLHQSDRIEKTPGMQSPGPVSEPPVSLPSDESPETTLLMLESKIYRIEKKTIFGAFPVCIVNPDLSVIFEDRKWATLVNCLEDGKKC